MNASDPQTDRLNWGRPADLVACALLSLLCAAVSSIVGVHGEFPLNDDWTYAETTGRLLEVGHLERTTWTWVPMITHAMVGSAFSLVFDFSFETLRMSGVFMGWLGVLGTYVLCRQVGAGIWLAWMGAAVIGLNPLHVNLSHTFMMDVPFAAILTWSLVCLCRGLTWRSWAWITVGTVLAEAAVLSRQPGLAVPIATVIVFVTIGLRSKRYLLAAAVIAGVTAFVHFVVPSLVYGPRDSGTMFDFSTINDTIRGPSVLWNLGINCFVHLAYLGLFLFPLAVGFAVRRGAPVRLLLTSLALTGLSVALLSRYNLKYPLGLNVIYDLGLGPPTLHGAGQLPRAGNEFWWSLTVLGLFTGFFVTCVLLTSVWKRRLQFRDRADGLLLLMVPVVYLPPLLARRPCFDRYLLPVLPPLVALLIIFTRPAQAAVSLGRALGIAALVLTSAFSIAGTRDYLEHHRARWTLLDELSAQGIEPADIHGGFEFMSWNAEDKDMADLWRNIREERFVISLAGELEGFQSVKSLSYQRLLPPGTQVLTVFEKIQ